MARYILLFTSNAQRIYLIYFYVYMHVVWKTVLKSSDIKLSTWFYWHIKEHCVKDFNIAQNKKYYMTMRDAGSASRYKKTWFLEQVEEK